MWAEQQNRELMEATYFIPQGYHAVIDGNKVIIKKGEDPVSNDLEEAAMQYAKSKHKDTTLQQIVSWDFKAGAQWQKEKIIAKACEWLENYFKGVSSGTVYLEDFKKAIKE